MKKHTVIVGLAIITSLLFACKKKDGLNQNLDPNKQENSNYMSTKKGSWWLFGARNGDITKRMATGKDSLKNGLLFSYFEKQDTNTKFVTPEYFGKNGNRYLSLYDFDGAQTNYATLVFLLDSAVAGTQWNNTQDYNYLGMKVNLLIESNVDFTGGTLTLGTKTYKEVTKVHNKLKGKPSTLPTYFDAGTIDIWFAKGIGVIMEDVNVSILTLGIKHTDSLLDYHIEPQ